MALPTQRIRSAFSDITSDLFGPEVIPLVAPRAKQAIRLRWYEFFVDLVSDISVDLVWRISFHLRAVRNLPLNALGGSQSILEQYVRSNGAFGAKETIGSREFHIDNRRQTAVGWQSEQLSHSHRVHCDLLVPMLAAAITVETGLSITTKFGLRIEYEWVDVSVAESFAVAGIWGSHPTNPFE